MTFPVALGGLITSIVALLVLADLSHRKAVTRLNKELIRHETSLRSPPPERKEAFQVRKRWSLRSSGARIGTEELAALCIEVASRLRAGSATDEAWVRAWTRVTGEQGEIGEGGSLTQLEGLGTEASALVLAATRFSNYSGAPLADVLLSCSRSLTDLEEGVAAQRVAFTGPRLSARVLTALPIVGLLGGELLGAHPLAWFLSGPLPIAIGLLGTILAIAGDTVARRLIRSAAQGQSESLHAPVMCDLAVSGLRGGDSIPSVLQSIGVAIDDSSYRRVAAELLLGAQWHEAWNPVPRRGMLLERSLQAAWEDGIAATGLLQHAATESRRRSSAAAKEAAEKLAVKLALPLGLLQLPAFILLGLVPIFFTLVLGQDGLSLQ